VAGYCAWNEPVILPVINAAEYRRGFISDDDA